MIAHLAAPNRGQLGTGTGTHNPHLALNVDSKTCASPQDKAATDFSGVAGHTRSKAEQSQANMAEVLESFMFTVTSQINTGILALTTLCDTADLQKAVDINHKLWGTMVRMNACYVHVCNKASTD